MSSRKHDLPPRWDGCAVIWDEWNPPLQILGDHFPRECCSACGSGRSPIHAGGLVAHQPATTHDELAHSIGTTETAGYRTLTAYRCLGCGHDQVLDFTPDGPTSGTWWDLGPEDYTDTGSDHPDGIDRSDPMTPQRYTTTDEYAELATTEAAALTRPCTHHSTNLHTGRPVHCGAGANEPCNNPKTGKPYGRPLIHPERRKEVST